MRSSAPLITPFAFVLSILETSDHGTITVHLKRLFSLRVTHFASPDPRRFLMYISLCSLDTIYSFTSIYNSKLSIFRIYLLSSHSSPLPQIIRTQPIPRSAILKIVARTQETTITFRRVHTPRVPAIPTITLATVLNTPVGETSTVSSALLERHRWIVVK
jgi:hypothetical protein